MIDYTLLDHSSAMDYLFYPRQYHSKGPANSFDLSIEVDIGISIMCRFYKGFDQGPWILYFHGNGEVVSDFDELSPLYTRRKLNLVVADYRGYGLSGGTPTLKSILMDAHKIFTIVREELRRHGFRDNLWVMGRSLGSMPALELASARGDEIMGLIIESGFTSIVGLIEHLDIPLSAGIETGKLYREASAMVETIKIPALIIHGEYDNIVPLMEGEDLYKHIGSEKKQLILIPAADHNDIMFVGLEQYFGAIQEFIKQTDPVGNE